VGDPLLFPVHHSSDVAAPTAPAGTALVRELLRIVPDLQVCRVSQAQPYACDGVSGLAKMRLGPLRFPAPDSAAFSLSEVVWQTRLAMEQTWVRRDGGWIGVDGRILENSSWKEVRDPEAKPEPPTPALTHDALVAITLEALCLVEAWGDAPPATPVGGAPADACSAPAGPDLAPALRDLLRSRMADDPTRPGGTPTRPRWHVLPEIEDVRNGVVRVEAELGTGEPPAARWFFEFRTTPWGWVVVRAGPERGAAVEGS
jgi:hypothetical protein